MLVYLMMVLIAPLAGMFMETASALVILTPIFIPDRAAAGRGSRPFWSGCDGGLAIGMATPPVAIDIYVASAVTGLSMEEISKPIMPMVGALIVVLLFDHVFFRRWFCFYPVFSGGI